MNDRETARDLSKRLEKAYEEIDRLKAEVERLKTIPRYGNDEILLLQERIASLLKPCYCCAGGHCQSGCRCNSVETNPYYNKEDTP